MKKTLAIVIAVSLLASSAMLETVPLSTNYQGRLTDAAGVPVSGSFDITFRIYDMAVGGNLLWEERQLGVVVSNGLFNVVINPPLYSLSTGFPQGMEGLPPFLEDIEQWLEIEVEAGLPFMPRTRLLSSPFAMLSYGMAGHIFTSPGHIYVIPNGPPTTGASLDMFKVDPSDPSQNLLPAVQLNGGTATTGASLEMFNTEVGPGPVQLPAVQINGGTATTGASLEMFNTEAGPGPTQVPAVQINGGTATTGASLEMFNTEVGPGPVQLPAVQINGGNAIWDPNLKLMHTTTGPGDEINTSNAELTVNGDMGSSLMLHHTDAVGIEPCVRLFSEGAAAGISIFAEPIPHLKRTSDSAVINLRTNTINAKIEMFGAAAGTDASIVLISDNNGGKVGINTDTPREALEVVGNICATGTIGVCSDERYKKNIETITNALALLEKMRGVNFNWRTSEFPDRKFSDAEQVGFIAQELKEVLPELVSQGSDGFYSVDYSRLTPVLVEAVKEQQKEITSLKSEMQELKRLVQTLASSADAKKMEVAVAGNTK